MMRLCWLWVMPSSSLWRDGAQSLRPGEGPAPGEGGVTAKGRSEVFAVQSTPTYSCMLWVVCERMRLWTSRTSDTALSVGWTIHAFMQDSGVSVDSTRVCIYRWARCSPSLWVTASLLCVVWLFSRKSCKTSETAVKSPKCVSSRSNKLRMINYNYYKWVSRPVRLI